MAKISFRVFNGPPQNTVKLVLAKCFLNFLSIYMKNVFYIISRFIQQNYVVSVKKKVILYSKAFEYRRKRKSWWKSKNKVLRHEKEHERTIDPIRFMKMVWSISALMFSKKILVRDWLVPGVIHLNVRVCAGSTHHPNR